MKPAILLLALTSIVLAQGPLDPPGPPGLTMRSLDEIEPRIPLNQTTAPGDATCVFKITKPGSYILTGNVKPPAGKHCMLIALLLPGVVQIDMKGFNIDGSDAGAGTSGVRTPSSGDQPELTVIRNGTIRNFGAGADFPPVVSPGTLELHDLHIQGGGAGVNTAGRLVMRDVTISGGSGIPVQMGSDSSFERVTIKHTAATPVIVGTGSRTMFEDVLLSSVMSGGSTTSCIVLGPESRIRGMGLRVSGATFTDPVLATTSGYTEVEWTYFRMELTNVIAPSACNSYSFGSSNPGIIGTTYGGDGRITAHNSTFSSAVVILPSAPGLCNNEVIQCALTGTTTTPTVLRVEADNCTVRADVSVAATATVSGGVIEVPASGTTINANIRGGNVGVRLSGGTGHTVEGCNLMGLLLPAAAVQISAGVTNSLVRNNRAARLAAGGVMVQNNGGATNFIAPTLTTPAQLNANTNPDANIVH